MIGTLDSQVIEKFKEFRSNTGKYLDLDIEKVEFELFPLHQVANFPAMTRISGGVDISIDNFNSLSEKEQIDYFALVSGTIENNQISGYIHKSRLSENSLSNSNVISWTRINGKYFFIQEKPVCTNDDSFIMDVKQDYYAIKYVQYSTMQIMRGKSFNWGDKAGKNKVKEIPIPIPKILNENYDSLNLQNIIVEFLEFWKVNYTDIFRQTVTHQKPILEKIEKALISVTLRYDKTIENSFNSFVKNKNMKLELKDIQFNKKPLYKDEENSLIEILNNQRIPITKNKRIKGKFPYYGASGISDYVNDYIFDDRLVLLGEDGAKWGANENSSFIAEGKFWVNNHAHIMKPIKGLLKDTYLVLILNMMNLDKYVNNSTPRKLSQTRLKEIEIELPYNSNFDSIELQEILIDFWEMILNNIDERFVKFDNIERLTDKIDEAFSYRTFNKIEWREE
jgi:hypothetical protein